MQPNYGYPLYDIVNVQKVGGGGWGNGDWWTGENRGGGGESTTLIAVWSLVRAREDKKTENGYRKKPSDFLFMDSESPSCVSTYSP